MTSRFLGAPLFLALAALCAARVSDRGNVTPGVARVSLVSGEVSAQRGDSGDWSAAALNQPLVPGDQISSGTDSRAEVQLDYANILRLAGNSQAAIANLTNYLIQVQIGLGMVDYVVLKGSEAIVEIDTPNVAVHPGRREGVYRVEINAGETRVIVRAGEAEISTPAGSTQLGKGQDATFRGIADPAVHHSDDAPTKDSWDSWNNDRDNRIYRAQSWNHTNRYYTGSEDLDGYGRWVNLPDYGPVWQPVVPADWAPYREGRWVWEPYWGWTWVSAEPWGWAPYHYGRWLAYDGSWLWWPGPVNRPYQPIWAPAYVSFFGFGGNWGVSAGLALSSVGWLPCGPGDSFFPWYGGSSSRFKLVEVTNVANPTKLRNVRGFPPLHGGTGASNLSMFSSEWMIRAVSTVPANRFGSGRVTVLPATHEMLREGRVVAGNLPIVPTRENLSATNRPASPSTVRGGQPQRFFETSQPAVSQPFDTQAAQIQAAVQRDGKFAPIRAAPGADTQKPSPILAYRSTPENQWAALKQLDGRVRVPARAGIAELKKPAHPGRRMRSPNQVAAAKTNRGTTGKRGGRGGTSSVMAAVTPRRSGVPVAAKHAAQPVGSLIADNRPPQGSQPNVPAPTSPAPRDEQPSNPQPTTASPAPADRTGWHRFGESAQNGGRNPASTSQTENRGLGNGSVPRPKPGIPMASTSPATEASPTLGAGWHKFTPQPRLTTPAPNRGGTGDHWNHFPSRSGNTGMGTAGQWR